MNSAEYLADNPYARFGDLAVNATVDSRRTFLRKTYAHLTVAIYALVLLEFLYFKTVDLDRLVPALLFERWGWFAVVAAFACVHAIADRWANSNTSVNLQYAGLSAYVLAFSIVLCPLLWIANHYVTNIAGTNYSPIAVAAVLTLSVFGILTAVVFVSRKDFSFLGPILGIAGALMMGAIVLSFFGLLNLGTGFCIFGVAFFSGAVLYDTSNILHHYRTEQYVAASLALFASVGLLFWYILRLVISMSDRR